MGIPGFPFLRDFRDPVVIIGTPFSTQTADDPDDEYVTGGYSQVCIVNIHQEAYLNVTIEIPRCLHLCLKFYRMHIFCIAV